MSDIDLRDFGRLEAKVDAILDNQGLAVEQMAALSVRQQELEKRVDKWEQRAVGALVIVGAIGAGAMWLVDKVIDLVKA